MNISLFDRLIGASF